jgi:hypothetical protein
MEEVMNTEFNINDYIWIEINEYGYQHLADKHKSFYSDHGLLDQFPEMNTPEYYKSQANEQGYTKMQMHSFLSDFGDKSGIGNKLLYSTNVRFDEKDLKKTKR